MEDYENTEIKELKERLYDKVVKELQDFKEKLKKESPEQIIQSSYKLLCMEEMKDYLTERDYSKFELKILVKREDLLEECYDDWLKCDGNFREVLEYSIDDTVDLIRDNEVKKQRNKDAR